MNTLVLCDNSKSNTPALLSAIGSVATLISVGDAIMSIAHSSGASKADLLETIFNQDSVVLDKRIIELVGLKAAIVYAELERIPQKELYCAHKVIASRHPYIPEAKIKKQLLPTLLKQKLIVWRKMLDDEIVALLSSKQPQSFSGSELYCQWCNSSTVILHKHHYPIPKKHGGIKIVEICPSCHYEFHYLQTIKIYAVAGEKIAGGES